MFDFAHTAVSTLSALLTPLAGVHATAVAVVVLTIAVRLLISPLSYAQARGQRRRAALAPRVRELQQLYAGEPARLHTEIVALYRAEKTGPLAGCLPTLAQLPFFLVLYRMFAAPPAGSDLLTARLFGLPLGTGFTVSAVYLLLLGVLGLLAWWFSRRIRRTAEALPGGRLVALLPYATLVVAVMMPLAAVLYLVTSTAWTALEHLVFRR